MKTIEITVDREGRTTVETKGFTGTECRLASRFVEDALGVVVNDRPTAEAFQAQPQPNKIDLHG
jgi:Protein of unknown function (DUF2997)